VPALTSAVTQSPASAATAPAPQGTAQQQVIVDMKNYAVVPKSITVAPGTTVVWRNDDATTHTVTADNKLFDDGDATGRPENPPAKAGGRTGEYPMKRKEASELGQVPREADVVSAAGLRPPDDRVPGGKHVHSGARGRVVLEGDTP
jgi:plastocyanin